jgi:hypothetical protein
METPLLCNDQGVAPAVEIEFAAIHKYETHQAGGM